jgi:hemerythrin-like metal-binding protein
MEWSSNLDVGVQNMNKEHQQLLSIMNKLYDRHQEKAPLIELKSLMNDLANYTVKHFQDEEAYFDSIGFPDADKHKLIHKDLLTKFGTHRSNFEASGTLDQSFFLFLKMWLSAHIQGIDSKYGVFAKTQGKAS